MMDETIDATAAVAALAALAQSSRLAVFRLLVEAAPDGVFPGEIATKLAIPANTLSFHLKTLTQAGLISSAQHGRNIRYRADIAQMQRLLSYLTENCCGGDVSKCAPQCAPTKAPSSARRAKASR
jgi:ArsR family transcriptional regulator, arsenate/arsenite/antimonite-responsive transcriptional repressor